MRMQEDPPENSGSHDAVILSFPVRFFAFAEYHLQWSLEVKLQLFFPNYVLTNKTANFTLYDNILSVLVFFCLQEITLQNEFPIHFNNISELQLCNLYMLLY